MPVRLKENTPVLGVVGPAVVGESQGRRVRRIHHVRDVLSASCCSGVGSVGQVPVVVRGSGGSTPYRIMGRAGDDETDRGERWQDRRHPS